MKVWVKGTGTSVDLTQRHYVASGGQAKVYAKGDTAYKIYHDPACVLPVGKFRALSVLEDSKVIKPEQVLLDAKNVPVGYTTRFVKDAHVLCQLFPKSFRDREQVTRDIVQGLVRKLREGVAHVHSKNILIVDLNEMNFLVSRDFRDIFFIDTDSYQVPGYPCPVLMESVRDWSVQGQQWSVLSDWFSFAVLTFQMFTGIHPFKGRYGGKEQGLRARLPSDPADDAFAVTRRRMQAHLSVFHPEVGVPAATYPFDVIPANYRAWYRALFVEGVRAPPPDAFDAVAQVVVRPEMTVKSGSLLIAEFAVFEGNIVKVWGDGSHLVVVTDKGVWLGGHRVPVAHVVTACGFGPKTDRVVLAGHGDPSPVLTDIVNRVPVPFALSVANIVSHDGRIYVRTEDQVHEVVLTDVGTRVIASTRPVANVSPHATRLFEGVVVQNLLGSGFVSLLSGPGIARQIRMKELDRYKVLDARYDRGVLMVVGVENGRYDRLIFRFDDMDVYDMRTVPDITPTGLNFVVLDSGVCVSLTEEDKLEIFSASKGSSSVKIVEDPALGTDMTLVKDAGSVLFFRGSTLYKMSLK